MEYFLNRLELCYYNILLTDRIEQKLTTLNKTCTLLKYFRITMDMFNYLYTLDSELFMNFINNCKKSSLILLTYDLQAIGKSINIPENTYLTYNGSFHIEYVPTDISSDSSHSEWGYEK